MCRVRAFRSALPVAAALLSLVGVPPAAAQSDAIIRGQVVARADGSALSAATLTLQSSAGLQAWQATASEDGRFVFRFVAPGDYLLLVEAPGFRSRELSLVAAPREIRTVTVSLQLSGIESIVEVAGTAASVSSTHSPSSTVLTGDRLERLPAGLHENLPEAIVAAAPGMIRGHDDFVHVRGHEIALNPMINGVSFWENPHALFSSGLSPEVIETVNVMTGGFPAEYGNRFGGVLDVVTKSGWRMRHDGSISVMAGGAGRRRVAGEFGGHRDRVAYYVFGSGAATERFLSPPDPEAIHDDGRTGRGFFQLEARLGQSGSLRSVVTADASNFEIPKEPRDRELRPLANAEQRTRQQSAIVSWTHPWSRTLAAASLYQRWSSARLLPASGPLTATARHERRLRTLGGKVDVTHLFGRHSLKVGVDAVYLRPEEELSYDYAGFRDYTHLLGRPHIHFQAGPVQFAGREAGGQLSAYVQDTIRLGERLSADVGVRVDRYALVVSATHVSPRINLAAHLPAGTVLHASYNRLFVPPPIEGVLSSSAGLTARIAEIGRPLGPLTPTTEDQVEAGALTSAGPLQVALTGYYRRTSNPVHTTVWPDSRVYSYASFERARAYGLEARIDAPQLARYGVTGYVNYALGRVDFYNPVTGGFITEAAHLSDTTGFRAPMDQTHTFTAGATYRHRGSGVWMGTAAEYGSGTPRGHGGGHDHGEGHTDHAHEHAPSAATSRVPAHFTVNLSLGVDLLRDSRGRGRLALQLDAENVTDEVYLIAQEGEFSPSQYSIPRLVSVTVRFRF